MNLSIKSVENRPRLIVGSCAGVGDFEVESGAVLYRATEIDRIWFLVQRVRWKCTAQSVCRITDCGTWTLVVVN